MHKRSTPRCVTYKEGPQIRGNGRTKENAPRNPDKGPHVRLPEKDKDELLPGGVGQTWPASHPDALRRGMPPTPPDHLLYMLLAGTDPEDYKRGLPPPLTRHTISYVKEKSREAPPLGIISLGSV